MMQLLPGAGLQEIMDQLEAAVDAEDGMSFQDTVSMLRTLAEPAGLKSLVGQILSDKERLVDIAARSYYHANSFLKLVLMAGDKNAWKLRLHIWHPQPDVSEPVTEDIHSHRWDFTTALLAGEYCAREFRVGPGDEYFHFKYLPVGAGKTFSLEEQGKEQLCNVFEANLPAGTIYHINHEVLHSISRSPGKAAASLVLQRPATTEFTNVYRQSPAGEQTKTEIQVQRPSVPQLRTELTHFLTWL